MASRSRSPSPHNVVKAHSIPLVVFAKPPLPGKAKTRLAAKLGPEGACKLATAFISDFFTMASQYEWAFPVLATTSDGSLDRVPGFPEECFPAGLDPKSIPRWLQVEGDLGAKIEGIVRQGLERATAVICCGADSPGRPVERLDQTLKALQDGADAVLGETEDGGYDILALKSCPEGLLSNLPWSQPNTFVESKKRFEERGMKVIVLDKWWDVDEIEDLGQLQKLIGSGGAKRAPATALALEEVLSVKTVGSC